MNIGGLNDLGHRLEQLPISSLWLLGEADQAMGERGYLRSNPHQYKTERLCSRSF